MEDYKPLCIRCGHELEEIDSYDEDVKTYKCPYCGAYEEYIMPDEDEAGTYPISNPNVTFKDEYHGYDGLCPNCGSHIIWSGDFMRSEILGDVDENDLDENNMPKDDSLASSIICPYCGASIMVVDCKPSEMKNYEAYKE